MTYKQFCHVVKTMGWTLAQIRCDEPPNAEILDAIANIGLNRWEKLVLRYQQDHEE